MLSIRSASRSLAVLTVFLAIGLLAAGCDSTGSVDSTNTETTAVTAKGGPGGSPGQGSAGGERSGQGSGGDVEVRVGHLSPDAPAVDVYVGVEPGSGDPAISGLSYPTFAPNASGDYLSLPSGAYDITVTAAGGTDAVIDVDGLTLESNKDYTILAVGELSPEDGEPAIQALPLVDNGDDDPALPPRSKTLVRFVHASPDAGAVDIAVDGSVVLRDVTFATASRYLKVAPGERTVEILKGGSAVLTIPATLTAGTKITAYVIGNATPEDGDAELSAVTSLDATSPAGTGPLGPGNGGNGPAN